MIAASTAIILSAYAKVHNTNATYQQNAHADRRAASQDIADACQDRTGDAFRACIADRVETYYQEQVTNEDLQAQQDMAFWAAALFISSTVLTTIGIGLLYLTLSATWRTLAEAEKTTTAALKSVSATEDIGERQLRPYIVYDSAQRRDLHAGSDKLIEIDVSFRNCGQNPGIITAVSSALYAPTGKGAWRPQGGSWRPIRMVVGPNQTEKIRFNGITADSDGNFSWFTIGILTWYESLSGNKFEDYVWLMFDSLGIRQDYPPLGYDLFRPDDKQRRENRYAEKRTE